jgi:hypothetical protein
VIIVESIEITIYVLNPYSKKINNEVEGNRKFIGHLFFSTPKLFDINIKEYPSTKIGLRADSLIHGFNKGSFPKSIMFNKHNTTPRK